jgi:Flp pilus assembly protein TadD
VAFTVVVGLGAVYALFFLCLQLFPRKYLSAFLAAFFFATHHWIISLCAAPFVDTLYYLSILVGMMGLLRWWQSRSRMGIAVALLWLFWTTTLRYEAWILASLACAAVFLELISERPSSLLKYWPVTLASPLLLGGFPAFWLWRQKNLSGHAFQNMEEVTEIVRGVHQDTGFLGAFLAQPKILCASSGLLLLLILVGVVAAFRSREAKPRRSHALYLGLILAFFCAFNSLRYFGVSNSSPWRLLLVHLICLMPYAGWFTARLSGRPRVVGGSGPVSKVAQVLALPSILGLIVIQSHRKPIWEDQAWIDHPPLQTGRILRSAFKDPHFDGLIESNPGPHESHISIWVLSGDPKRFYYLRNQRIASIWEASALEKASLVWSLSRAEEGVPLWVLERLKDRTGSETREVSSNGLRVKCRPGEIEFWSRLLLEYSRDDGEARVLAHSVAKASPEYAIPFVERALEEFPGSPDLCQAGAGFAAKTGNVNLAEDWYLSAVEEDGGNPNLLFEFGSFLLGSGRAEEALPHLHKAAENFEGEAHAYVWCVAGNAALANERFDVARDCYNRAIEVDPEYWYGYQLRGNFHQRTGEVRLASIDLARAAAFKQAEEERKGK